MPATLADDTLARTAFATIRALGRLYAARRLSPVEATREALMRIDRLGGRINAFAQRDDERALAAAREAEARFVRGVPLGPLDGVPFSVKDALAVQGFPTRRGSKVTSAEPARESAPAVDRVLEGGGIIIGITTMPEYGAGPVTISPLTGITRNPWNPARTSGGSSGGAAASIAAGMGTFALATDAGGSIRIPSSFCGVVGFKATGGLVPSYPANVAGGLSSPGPIARSVEDCAIVLNAIARPDIRDPEAARYVAIDYLADLEGGVRGLRIAASAALGYARRMDAEVLSAFHRAVAVLADLGAKLRFADPPIADPLPAYKTLFMSGFAYALRGLDESRMADLGDDLSDVVAFGRTVTLAQVLDAHQIRRELGVALHRFHCDHDLLVTPTLAVPAFAAERREPAEFEAFREPRAWTPFGYPFNLTQQPAVTVPCGATADGLPIGIQIVGPRFADALVLRAARALESAGLAPAFPPPGFA